MKYMDMKHPEVLFIQNYLNHVKKTNQKWLFNKTTPGKLHLFDGRTGQPFSQSILIGTTYLMKLIHIVMKIHARSTGLIH